MEISEHTVIDIKLSVKPY